MKKGPFKMKGMDFGASPVKQNSKKTFESIKKAKSKAVEFVKSLNIKDPKVTGKQVLKNVGKANLLSLLLSPKSASASDQAGLPPSSLENYEHGRGQKIK